MLETYSRRVEYTQSQQYYSYTSQDPLAVRGGIGERSLRQILEHAIEVADRSLPNDRDAIKKMVSEISTMVEALCELRDDGKGTSPQAEGLARGIDEKLVELQKLVSNSQSNSEKWGGQQPAHTVSGRLEQAQKWLSHPERDDKGLGQRAIALIIAEGKKVADGLPGIQRAEILSLCDEVDYLSNQLSDLCKRGLGNSPKAQEIAKLLSQKLHELKNKIQDAVVNRVVEDFIDIVSPLKHFTEAVHVPEGTPGREANFEDRANYLSDWSRRAAKTGKMVAAGGSGGNKKLAEALVNSANQLESLTPQLVNAGRIRMNYPNNAAADKHFENLRTQYADTVGKMRNLCDEATDSAHFVKISEDQMRKHALMCEDAILKREPNKMVDHTTAIARLANRVLQVAKQEADNSEDPAFISEITRAADAVQAAVAPMVQDAKAVALNIADPAAASRWRESNKRLLNAVGNVRKTLTVPGDLNGLHINDVDEYPKYRPEPIVKTHPIYNRDAENRISPPKQYRTDLYQEIAPPRPPLPGGEVPPPRPPPPETDDEDDMFMHAPLPNQPIMAAAHGLHQEVRQWSSKDNEIIAAAKKMALLMGRLSQLVRGEGGTKRDLIDCAKAIAEASEEVARLAKELARECTDKRMRTSLLQVCERIPTIGTQLKILSTVKATMLGAQEILPRKENAELQGGSEEDQEATDMLVGNAQNLMQSVKETVRAAEAASIKIRTDAGIRLRWVRRQPWYHY